MIRLILTAAFFLPILFSLTGQTPKLYINLATHNEMSGEFYDTDSTEYINTRDSLQVILDKVIALNGKWNFQTCSKFVLGALNWENAASSSTDFPETMFNSGVVQIDPRNKKLPPQYTYNISDVYHLLDSCGVTSTHTAGGFIHYPYTNEDWTQFRQEITGDVYGLPWQAEIIWGGGSPNHINDCNNYGFWKPLDGDSESNFYTHAPDSNLWLVGNGCAPVIYDTTADVQWIVRLMRQNVEALQAGWWPTDKLYSLTLMINCKHLDAGGYVRNVLTVLDSMDVMVNEGAMEWAFITEKLQLFQDWSQQNGILYSQWSCAEATDPDLSQNEIISPQTLLYPNPASFEIRIVNDGNESTAVLHSITGQKLKEFSIKQSETTIDLSNFPAGMYIMAIGDSITKLEIRK